MEKGMCCGKQVDGVCCIKVLGTWCCKNCDNLYCNVQKVVEKLNIVIQVEYITDMEKIVGYGVMSMPALVVNEKVVSAGKVLSPADIAKLLI
ncbi:MAG: thioredoxin family protein [Spirochaetia bacterium]|nr:thioredoxin family protein [Spirochaetia bacterium]